MTTPRALVVILEAKPDCIGQLEEALKKVTLLSREESTCIQYRLHRDETAPHRFILYKIWESKSGHEAQFEKPYIKELIEVAAPLLDGPYQTFHMEEIT